MNAGDILLKFFVVFALGFTPIAEVRGAIPLAYKFFMVDVRNTLLFSIASLFGVIGNLVIAPLVLFALDKIEKIILKSKLVPAFIKKAYLSLLSYVRARAKKYENIEAVGLTLFVAIPLPVTGAWTGSLIAYILGLEKKKSLVCIELGVLCATTIMLTAILLFTSLLRVLGIEI
ncbi:MAG: small multi-drug export protein [Ignisphaera sp.]|uniref:Ligand-binding protein SH3 n=1 Tax=Ignisphaera aggregans TaxID=334771 RepID=A0A7C4NKV7_9CREN